MIFFILVSSCKKEKIEQPIPKTFADFEKIMATDKDFNLFISSSLELEELLISAYRPSTRLFNRHATKRKALNNIEISEISTLKNFDELLNFYKEHQVENAQETVAILKKQLLSYHSFVIKYPEIRNISISDKKLLISNALKNKEKSLLNIASNHSNRKLMVAPSDPDPLYDYNSAVSSCQASYRYTFLTIWTAADIGLTAALFDPTGISSISVFATAVVATDIARAQMFDCFDRATDVFYHDIR